MKKHHTWSLGALLAAALLLASCQKEVSTTSAAGEEVSKSQKAPVPEASVSVYATGLNNPRGLEFGPDGALYVAEGGTGGTNSTEGLCEQVEAPIGPYTGSPTGGRISRISANGTRTTVTDQLPSSQTSPLTGSLVSGVADVAFIGNTLYALLAGGGCSHGVAAVPNGIVRINDNGSWTLVANLSAWELANPVAEPAADFEPEGTWYDMVAVRGDLYTVDPNQGQLVKVTTDGTISRVLDFSVPLGHVVPTALAYHGNFYVGNLNTFPIVDGSSNIYKVNPSGEVQVRHEGLTAVLGLAFDDRSRLYVLEMTVGAEGPTPGLGRVVRIEPNGTMTTIATGLSLPTGMAMGPDGNLYVSNWGFGPPIPGQGQVLKITLSE
jgi:hypothetical protein